jgi:hypothetical protein
MQTAIDQRAMSLADGGLVDYRLSIESPDGELQTHPFRQIARTGAGAARRRLRVRISARQRLPLTAKGDVERGTIRATEKVAMA